MRAEKVERTEPKKRIRGSYVSLWLTRDERHELAQAADGDGVSISEWIRRAIERALTGRRRASK